jgi:uncharacterized membrane protein
MKNTRTTLLKWIDEGHIEPGKLAQAITESSSEVSVGEWLRFLRVGFLWMAIIATACGAIFFFAYNWQNMSRFIKFTLIESTLLIATILHIRLTAEKNLSSATLMGMALVTGALLALVGQTYQTGADPWQLFATWCLLTTPWAIMACSNSLWILWLVLINLSVGFYIDISQSIFGIRITGDVGWWIFALLNSVLLIAFEAIYFLQHIKNKEQENCSVVKPRRYVNQLIGITAGVAVTILAISSIFSSRHDEFENLIFYFSWIALVFYWYRYKLKDLLLLSAVTLSGIIIVICGMVRLLDKSFNDASAFLLVSIVIIGLSTLAGIWLKTLAKDFELESALNSPEYKQKEQGEG